MCCPLVFEFSVGIGVFVIGLGQISFFFSFVPKYWKFKFYYLHLTSFEKSIGEIEKKYYVTSVKAGIY